MSEHADQFVKHLQTLDEDNRGAMATLRHSLAFAPGAFPGAYPYVERFVSRDRHASDARRLALYAVAGLFALHPEQQARSFAAAFGALWREKERDSIEKRFIALLSADAENIVDYLRQATRLLKSESYGYDYAGLLDALAIWMDPRAGQERLDRLRRDWARDFYRAPHTGTDGDTAEHLTSTSAE